MLVSASEPPDPHSHKCADPQSHKCADAPLVHDPFFVPMAPPKDSNCVPPIVLPCDRAENRMCKGRDTATFTVVLRTPTMHRASYRLCALCMHDARCEDSYSDLVEASPALVYIRRRGAMGSHLSERRLDRPQSIPSRAISLAILHVLGSADWHVNKVRTTWERSDVSQ